MRAAYVQRIVPNDPLDGLVIGPRPEPTVPYGWTVVTVRAAALNRHDLWSLAGVGLAASDLPMILGCDAAGLDPDGRDVVVHAVLPDPQRGDLGFSLLSERYQGTLAERVAVPIENVFPKPPHLSFAEAACLPTAWLTAFRMLFVAGGARPGFTVLVQGAGGGVATAAVMLGAAAGLRMWVTTRSAQRGERAERLGATGWFPSGGRLPERVDVVLDTVGAATWEHSIKALRPGGTIVVSGATSGRDAQTDLSRVFYRQLRIVGSTMGSRDEFGHLLSFCALRGLRPIVDRILPLSEARSGLEALARGEPFGKVVLAVDA